MAIFIAVSAATIVLVFLHARGDSGSGDMAR
jgi:hypothetical protein